MIYLLLADGFEEAEALVPLDILRRGGLTVRTVGITGDEVCGAHGITVQADILPQEINEIPSLVILPGGIPGTPNLGKSPVTAPLVERTLQAGGRVAAICAAPTLLGKWGYLHGIPAVCYPGMEAELTGAVPSDERVVTAGSITTAVGMGAAYEFGLELLRLMTDDATARRVAESGLIRK